MLGVAAQLLHRSQNWKEEEDMVNTLHLSSLHHISLVCKSVERSIDFYKNVLGFAPVRRPGSLSFDGAWLFGCGIGVHLLQSGDPNQMPTQKTEINPRDNHISFQCESMATVEKKLMEMEIECVRQRVEEAGVYVDQLFFHDPDGFMIEICNCNNLPIVPLAGEPARSCSPVVLQKMQNQQPVQVVGP